MAGADVSQNGLVFGMVAGLVKVAVLTANDVEVRVALAELIRGHSRDPRLCAYKK